MPAEVAKYESNSFKSSNFASLGMFYFSLYLWYQSRREKKRRGIKILFWLCTRSEQDKKSLKL